MDARSHNHFQDSSMVLENSRAEVDHLRQENTKLKDVIMKRTEAANKTIMKLAQMKKEAEEQNYEYLKTIEVLAHNLQSLKEQVWVFIQ